MAFERETGKNDRQTGELDYNKRESRDMKPMESGKRSTFDTRSMTDAPDACYAPIEKTTRD